MMAWRTPGGELECPPVAEAPDNAGLYPIKEYIHCMSVFMTISVLCGEISLRLFEVISSLFDGDVTCHEWKFSIYPGELGVNGLINYI